jgi:hypothetical protein
MCTGLEPLLLGTAAVPGGAAATAGLIGTGGAFSAAQALMLGGSVLSGAASIGQGQQQKAAYAAQAQMVENDAAYRADAAKAQAEKIRRMGKAQQGEAKAALAASGVKLGEGTALEIDQDIAQGAQEDSLSSILTGRRALSTADTEASMLRTAGGNAVTNSALAAGATFMKAGWKTR